MLYNYNINVHSHARFLPNPTFCLIAHFLLFYGINKANYKQLNNSWVCRYLSSSSRVNSLSQTFVNVRVTSVFSMFTLA